MIGILKDVLELDEGRGARAEGRGIGEELVGGGFVERVFDGVYGEAVEADDLLCVCVSVCVCERAGGCVVVGGGFFLQVEADDL